MVLKKGLEAVFGLVSDFPLTPHRMPGPPPWVNLGADRPFFLSCALEGERSAIPGVSRPGSAAAGWAGCLDACCRQHSLSAAARERHAVRAARWPLRTLTHSADYAARQRGQPTRCATGLTGAEQREAAHNPVRYVEWTHWSPGTGTGDLHLRARACASGSGARSGAQACRELMYAHRSTGAPRGALSRSARHRLSAATKDGWGVAGVTWLAWRAACARPVHRTRPARCMTGVGVRVLLAVLAGFVVQGV